MGVNVGIDSEESGALLGQVAVSPALDPAHEGHERRAFLMRSSVPGRFEGDSTFITSMNERGVCPKRSKVPACPVAFILMAGMITKGILLFFASRVSRGISFSWQA